MKDQEEDNVEKTPSEYTLCCGCFPRKRKKNDSGTAILTSSTDSDRNDDGYWGHFVVIIGYDKREKIFILNDPSPNGELI